MGPKIFKKLFTAFCTLAKNGDDLEKKGEAGIFLTEGSIVKNLVKQFGYKSEFLAKRFYYLMTGRQPGRRVTLPEYMGFLQPLFFSDASAQQRLIFTLYDIDGDGFISGADLV